MFVVFFVLFLFFFAFSSSTLSASEAKQGDFRWLQKKTVNVNEILPDVRIPYLQQCCLITDDEVVLKEILPDYVRGVVLKVVKTATVPEMPHACAEVIKNKQKKTHHTISESFSTNCE